MVDRELNSQVFELDWGREVDRICGWLRGVLARVMRRRGLVVAVSGGIDSSVTLALAAQAVGRERVAALMMPERQSADETLELSRLVADHFGVAAIHEEITPLLEAAGYYRRYAEAVRRVIPAYDQHWRSKIVIANVLENEGFNRFSLVAQAAGRKWR
jgi:NAD+ synthase